MTKKSAFTFLIDYINSRPIGTEISRYQMQSAFRREFQQTRNINAIDSYKSYFTKLGYLEQTKVKGFYVITNHLPDGIKAVDLRLQYNEATGFTERKQDVFDEEMSNAEYLQLKYKPVEFIIINGLTFIQGTMLNCLIKYINTDSEDIEEKQKPIHEIIYYANVSNFLKHISRSVNYSSAIVDRFCEINEMDLVTTSIFKRVLQCNWNLILEESRNLLNIE